MAAAAPVEGTGEARREQHPTSTNVLGRNLMVAPRPPGRGSDVPTWRNYLSDDSGPKPEPRNPPPAKWRDRDYPTTTRPRMNGWIMQMYLKPCADEVAPNFRS